MSVGGWGSRELTSKQDTFPLIMLFSFWLLDWAIRSHLCKLGGEEFLCVSICLWQTGPRAVAPCARTLMQEEVLCGGGGPGQGWLLCVHPCCGFAAVHQTRVCSPPGIIELQCDRGSQPLKALLWPSHRSGSLNLGATITLELAMFLGCPGTDKSPFW